MGYIRDKILSEADLEEAKSLASSIQFKPVFQQYNLFDMERADIPRPESYGFAKTLLKRSRLTNIIGFYFLRYVPGSFTRMHEDNNSELTIVTLLDDKDLVGGHAIVTDTYKQRERPANEICNRSVRETTKPPYGKNIIMDVVPMELGESLVYGPEQTHGVSKVYEGSRLVLISWFNSKESKENK